MSSALHLETDRLIMRPHVRDDLDDCLAMWSDPTVTRFIGGKPSTREEMWARLLRYIGHWTLLGYGFWVVREKASGRFVGEVGFADFKRDLEPPLGDYPEMGWVLTPSMHGKGYATEAVQAALRWANAHWPATDSVCLIVPENVASLRVAARCGFVEHGRATYKNAPTIVLHRAAESV